MNIGGAMKFGSLFTGVGGFDLGFEQAGFNIVFANEYKIVIRQTFKDDAITHTSFDDSVVDSSPVKILKYSICGSTFIRKQKLLRLIFFCLNNRRWQHRTFSHDRFNSIDEAVILDLDEIIQSGFSANSS